MRAPIFLSLDDIYCMWSAIPVALLCMIVNWSERKQGSGPKGDEVL